MAEGYLWNPVQGYDEEEVMIAGTFYPQGTSAPQVPDGTNSNSKVNLVQGAYKVTRASPGVFSLIFLSPNWTLGAQAGPPGTIGQLLDIELELHLNALSTLIVQAGSWTPATATLVVEVENPSTGSATDIAANANNRVSFCAIFQWLGASISQR